MIIISLMLWIIDIDKDVLVNKEIINDNIEINYPYFNDNKIDNFINEYLDRYRDKNGIIDYDYDNNDNKYCVVFYKYFFDSNIYSYDLDSFMIDLDSSTISMVYTEVFNYDIITNKKINNSDKLIALTFDDGPNYNTGKVLDVLAKYNVKATFFVLGSKAKDNKKILKRAYDSGMEIGNHTFNHLLLTKYKENVIKDEIDKTSSVIFEVTGRYPKLLRPSYGVYNNIVKKIGNMPIIIWDIDTLDWKYHNSKRIASRVINKVKDGDIILMHDIYSATANSLNIIIPELQNRGYTFVTIPELFYYKEITLEKGMVYGYAR
jgi:peptidoglycan/xylan/chitin deacetylase (PgdA/CDA1 family)